MAGPVGVLSSNIQAGYLAVRTRSMTLTNYCWFITDFIDRNPGYARVVDADKPGRAHPCDAAPRAAEPGS